ncbi:hypothetical protein LTR27_006294 [Elasticomyces elasticus]|nr:hypothetical protein LTR27_006294 [Elasticomyces elasticus]
METDTSSPSNTRSARAMRSDSISEQDFNHFVVNTTSEVDDGKGRTNVWVTHRGTSFPPDDLAREVNISALALNRKEMFEPSSKALLC